ncbi:MAG: HAD family hydrolase [Desulfurococcaceae archaeon]
MKARTNFRAEPCGYAVGFDIWGTLLDLEKLLGLLAERFSKVLGEDKNKVLSIINETHKEARDLRRTRPHLGPREILDISQGMLSERLRVSRSTLFEVMVNVFSEPAQELLYEDTLPALSALYERGVVMGVIGNVLFWPSSLTRRLLEGLGIASYFKAMLFSDEVGFSKPDREIFIEFSRVLGLPPGRIIYVGDNVVEDVGGALSAGFIGILVKRNSGKKIFVPELRAGLISDLRELLDVCTNVDR